ncbi:hypothetical protein ACMD2_09520 [Ananas comosus]|uniref:Uncharacterized protein n=1 Tax=Ananas comosus TaxID=4615 RepID=A0A199UE23_ANACO|nr:hypothetical protein ACMD2_09520 [Ananas comosus]
MDLRSSFALGVHDNNLSFVALFSRSLKAGLVPIQHSGETKILHYGTKTDIIISKYTDSFLVMVTQIGSMGTILHASHCSSSRALILSLGLKDHSQEILKDIISAVIENRLW